MSGIKSTSGGTQSPSLTSSGQDSPLGVSNVKGDKPQAVPDAKQRESYLETSETRTDVSPKAQTQSSEKVKTD